MTAVELLFFIFRACLSIGIGAAMWNVHPAVGGIAGCFAFVIFPRLVVVFAETFGDKPIGKPTCLNGCCQDKDYKWVRSENGLPICKCKCGVEYLADGNRFWIIDADGSRRPFMIWSGKTWAAEQSRPPAPREKA
jgi:hypothetical protein